MKDDQERTPLRTILQNFINHIENLETRRIEDSYEKEFQELKFFSEILKTSKQYNCSEGEKEVNRKKNRYKDILPFDGSRVILDEYAGVPGSDYINANFIKGASGSPAYIACQGPLPHTVNDFWRMVVECEVQVIVMACNQEEAGKHKCENYWVEREGEEKQFGMVTIRLLKASIVCPDFLVRTMLLKYTNSQAAIEERTVCQFHYSAWPDHGVPPLVRPLLDMVRLVRDTQASETLPVLVHCSAGCGRTGTICAIDYVFGLLRAGKLSKDFSLYTLVRDMRKQRIAMVQTKEQYVLVHQAVRELFCEQLRMIDAHPYENIDANGMPLIKEPTYATVNSNEENAEKQDGKEKEASVLVVGAPPLPHKKKVHVASSKQEKEVENLTEKQRSIVEHSSGSESGSLSSGMSSLLSRPRISKLKALFERNSTPRESRNSHGRRRGNHQVTRSHSLGPIRKVEVDAKEEVSSSPPSWRQPIPGRGILRVPQLNAMPSVTVPVPKPVLPVKRSKSLKVLGTGERQKLSVLVPEVSRKIAVVDQTNARQVDGCDVVLVKNKSVVSIKTPSVSDKKPSVPPKALLFRNRDVETSEYLSTQARTSRDGILPPQSIHTVVEPTPRHRQIDYMTWRNYENVQSPLRRRHSLESVILEDVAPTVSLGQPTDNGLGNRSKFHNSHHLDKDARKLLQDCRDYLFSSSKVDSRSPVLLPVDKSTEEMQRNEQFQHLSVDAQRKINAIVAGLGVRERRNSFRQAVGMSRDLNGKVRDYESIWPGGNISGGDTGRGGSHHNAAFNPIPMQPFKSPSNPFIPMEARATSNSFSMESRTNANRVHGDEQTRFYQKPVDDLRFQNSKHNPKSLVHKSSGSLRVKGSQVLAFSRGSELEDSGGLQQTKTNFKKSDSLEKTKEQLKHSSRSNPWSRADQPREETNHSIYSDFRTPLKRNDLEASDTKTLPYLDPRNTSGREDKSSETSDWQRPIVVPADQRLYVKRVGGDERVSQNQASSSAFTEQPKQNGILSMATSETKIQNPPNSDPRGPIRRVENTGKTNSGNVTFQNPRVNIWPGPNNLETSPSKPWIEPQKSSPRTNPVWLTPTPLPATSTKPELNVARQMGLRTTRREMSPKRASNGDHHSPRQANETSSRGGYVRNEAGRQSSSTAIGGSPRRGEDSRINAITSPYGDADAVSYGLVAGVQLRQGSRDDLALCPTAPPRVRRHASVVLMRRSLIDTTDGPATPLTIWNGSREEQGDWAAGAAGVDLDTVAASIKPRRPVGDQTATLTRALESLNLRKATQRAEAELLAQQQQLQGFSAQSPSVKKQQYL